MSSGEFESRDSEGKPHFHDMYEYSWGQYIARKNGLKAYNFSRGGMSAKWFIKSFADEKDFWNKDLACQAYVIALGANDQSSGIQIGDVEDYKEPAKEIFCHYYGEIIRRYKEIQPRAKFFLVTMPRVDNKKIAARRAEFHKVYLEFADHFDNTYCIDLYKYAPVYNAEFDKQFKLYGHMNASGYILTANMIDSYINYIIRHNPEDFKRVGFIGNDLY